MFLQNYIPSINKNKRTVFFSGIAFDSNDVKKDNIFFAIKGNSFDGNDYIDLAIKRGAKIIISEKKIIKKKKRCSLFTFFKCKKIVSRNLI